MRDRVMPEVFILSRICPRCGGSEFKRIMDASLGSPTSFRCNFCGAEVDFVYSDPSLNDVTPKSLWDRAWMQLNYQQWTDAENTFSEVLKRAPYYTRALWGMCLAKKHCVDTRAAHGSRAVSQIIALFNKGDFSAVINTPDNEIITKTIMDYFGTDLVMALDIIEKNDLMIEREYFRNIFSEIGQDILETYTKEKYDYAAALSSSDSIEQLRTSLKRFSEISWYKDSKERIFELKERTQRMLYKDCIGRFESSSESVSFWQNLASDFDLLGDYKQACHYANKCRKMSSKLKLIKAGCIICSIAPILAVLAFVIVFVFFKAESLEYYFSMITVKLFPGWGDPDDLWFWQELVVFLLPLCFMSVLLGISIPFCFMDSFDGKGVFVAGILICSIALTVCGLKGSLDIDPGNTFATILLSPLFCALIAAVSSVPGFLAFFLSGFIVKQIRKAIKLL